MKTVYCGTSELAYARTEPKGDFYTFDNSLWYRIENYDQLSPFFMSITNPDNIWMFISSTGGLTCGRESADNALFPYVTVDKVTESTNSTGSYTAFLVEKDDKQFLWNPLNWDAPRVYHIQRNLLKTINGDRILFEEINHTLGLAYRMSWEASPRFGIHRHSQLENLTPEEITVHYLDGVRNILPAGADTRLQTSMSTLLDGYKRNELDSATGLGILALSATLTDLAEPSESLQATTLWSYGLPEPRILLSEEQIKPFTHGHPVTGETDIKGKRGAYFLTGTLSISGKSHKKWGMCAELKQDHGKITFLRTRLEKEKDKLCAELSTDLQQSRQKLDQIIKMNDGHQNTGSLTSDVHHRANVLFNCMRGGYFIEGYTIDTRDFTRFAKSWNSKVTEEHGSWFAALPEKITVDQLHRAGQQSGNPIIERLSLEYLPLTFSRRHGDPSRPWNQFFIKTSDGKGNPILGYQGNWRDIFQNWEALCLSYPAYLPGIITKFLNATTIDGYNPYRISDQGIDWEIPDPHDPWANIGYWSDHQIIYLAKLLEHCDHYLPEALQDLGKRDVFTFADVPYRIKNIDQLLENPFSSIVFHREHHEAIMERVESLGSDGRLIHSGSDILTTGFVEKLLILLLAKVANFVPGGGIWMNTQRPEWNDANNALAGWGVSMVTLAYLIRYLASLETILNNQKEVHLHKEVREWLSKSASILQKTQPALTDPEARFKIIQSLGAAATEYRTRVYATHFDGTATQVAPGELAGFLKLCTETFTATLNSTMHPDGTYESYQVLEVKKGQARLRPLYPMLEGQVSGLSVEGQKAETVIHILETLQKGPLYREDQHSYMLYPNRELQGYLAKNCISPEHAGELELLSQTTCIEAIVQKDSQGTWHFTSTFRNVHDLNKAATDLSEEVRSKLADMFEETFNHAEFTGRSGTFFAFEGLGSIYWHMVSKLMLAVQEQLIQVVLSGKDGKTIARLKTLYQDVRAGIGFNKTPEVYGAFPTDPYSHTPWGQGAKQPGMTGQVKEEIITRFTELGLVVKNGCISFYPELILEDQWNRETPSLSFSFCLVPILITRTGQKSQPTLVVHFFDGSIEEYQGHALSREISREVFLHTQRVKEIRVQV